MSPTDFLRCVDQDANQGFITCASSLIDRCLPWLAILEQHGITHLKVLHRIEYGVCQDMSIMEPRSFGEGPISPKHRDAVRSAVWEINRIIEASLEDTLAGDEDEQPSSFLAHVTISRRDELQGWVIRGEVIATVAEYYPTVTIKLS